MTTTRTAADVFASIGAALDGREIDPAEPGWASLPLDVIEDTAPAIRVEDTGHGFTDAEPTHPGTRARLTTDGAGWEAVSLADPTFGDGLTTSAHRLESSHGLDLHGWAKLDPATVRLTDHGSFVAVQATCRPGRSQTGRGSITVYADPEDRTALAAVLARMAAALLDPSTDRASRA